MKKQQRAYDAPTRILHWAFAGLFLNAFGIAKIVDSESPAFSFHMLCGLMLFAVTSIRVIWGFIGPKYARFSAFELHPSKLAVYFYGMVRGGGRIFFGHNPASSWIAIVMYVLALGLGITGWQMASGQKETFEDIHELLANAFALSVLGHIAGLVIHTLRHRDPIGMAMLHGKKNTDGNEVEVPARPLLAAALCLLLVALSSLLVAGYDANSGTLKFGEISLQLRQSGEAED
jgi:cytochrome b